MCEGNPSMEEKIIRVLIKIIWQSHSQATTLSVGIFGLQITQFYDSKTPVWSNFQQITLKLIMKIHIPTAQQKISTTSMPK